MKISSFLILIILFGLKSCGQIKIPSDFTETDPPKISSSEWRSLSFSNEFGVKFSNGQLQISKVKEVDTTGLKLLDGRLLGVNRGEWGGKVLFIPDSKSMKTILIKDGNIKFIFSFKNKMYFIEGLAHLRIDKGALYELDRTENKFTYKKILDFEDAPEAFAIYGDKLLIAGYKNFYVMENFQKQTIFKDAFWASLYPNSIAVQDLNNVFLGIRGGIVKLDLINKNLKFFKYSTDHN